MGGGLGAAPVFPFVLTLESGDFKGGDFVGGDRRIANEFEKITQIATQVSPGQNLGTAVAYFGAEVQGLIKEEDFLVLIGTVTATLFVVVLSKLLLTFLVGPLDYQLVLKFLAGATDRGGGVLEDELGVTLGRQRANEIELTLGDFDDGFLGSIPKEKFAHYKGVVSGSLKK